MANPADVIKKKRSAFVLRIAPSGIDRVDEALKSSELIIGWSRARGLLDKTLNGKNSARFYGTAITLTTKTIENLEAPLETCGDLSER